MQADLRVVDLRIDDVPRPAAEGAEGYFRKCAVLYQILHMQMPRDHTAQSRIAEPPDDLLPIPGAVAAREKRVYRRDNGMVLGGEDLQALLPGIGDLCFDPLQVLFRKAGTSPTVLVVVEHQDAQSLAGFHHIGQCADVGLVGGDGIRKSEIPIKVRQGVGGHRLHVVKNLCTVIAAGILVTAPVVGGGEHIDGKVLSECIQFLPQFLVADLFAVVGQIPGKEYGICAAFHDLTESIIEDASRLGKTLLVGAAAQGIGFSRGAEGGRVVVRVGEQSELERFIHA